MSNTKAPRDDSGSLSSMRRYPEDGWIAGVCAGIADYFGWSVKLIRVLVIIAFVFSGFFPLGVVYIALWYLMDPADAGMTMSATPTRRAGSSPGHSRMEPGVTPDAARARFDRLERRLRQIEACVTQEELELRREFKNLEA
ncbi:envelope stress response membrane protein PspC [Solimonas terrae]|uniref:Envelope stress response membrane protein PspC n=1 Tax=Solimonas terrae TaxID=1396819 RepID=A0A6M2BMW2_9GAMM|nr:envelope stress response membrane protein PspC [Solimonas terrae]NGY03427.1 envelope stress response membrane protein PspC [Solimonas terrae]